MLLIITNYIDLVELKRDQRKSGFLVLENLKECKMNKYSVLGHNQISKFECKIICTDEQIFFL